MNLKNEIPLQASPEIVFREEEEGAFLFNPETGELKCLNSIGSVIWSLCDGKTNSDQLEKSISEQYPVISRQRIHEDLTTFLLELLDIGYLKYSPTNERTSI